MRSVISLIVFLIATQLAYAGGTTPLALPDDTQLSEVCGRLARVPTEAIEVEPVVLAAALSMAMCLVDQRFAALELRDDNASIDALIHAALPAAEILDRVNNSGDVEYRILATRLGGDILTAMAVRMRGTVPANHGSARERVDLERRRDVIEQRITPWLQGAAVSYAEVVELTAAHASLMKNPVVASAARDATASLRALGATQVATAEGQRSSQK